MPRKNKIILRTGSVAPTASDFVTSEPAWDSINGKLYVKNASGTMVEIGSAGGISDPYDLGTYPLITISAQPQTVTIVSGNSTSVSVTAAATLPSATLSYQWQRSTDSGATWSSVSGATSSSLTITTPAVGTYQYRGYLTANLSAVYTSAATVTVQSSTQTATLTSGGGNNSWRWEVVGVGIVSFFDYGGAFTVGIMDDGTIQHAGWRTVWSPAAKPSSIVSAILTIATGARNGNAFTVVARGAALNNAGQGLTGSSTTTASATASAPSSGNLVVDVTSIVAEIVGRSGWASGNSIVIYLFGTNAAINNAWNSSDDTAGSLQITYV